MQPWYIPPSSFPINTLFRFFVTISTLADVMVCAFRIYVFIFKKNALTNSLVL